MKNLNIIQSVNQLVVGDTYTEDNNTYYLYTCLSIDKAVINRGWNIYGQSAVFSVTTKTGRKLENDTKYFNYNN